MNSYGWQVLKVSAGQVMADGPVWPTQEEAMGHVRAKRRQWEGVAGRCPVFLLVQAVGEGDDGEADDGGNAEGG